jgi:uncharacterized phage-like protein YoqJ
MKACFIGHRKIENTKGLATLLNQTITELLTKGVTTFLFGSNSDFDKLSWEVVSSLKKRYPFIKRVYVRASYPHIDKDYEQYLLKSYEETYFPLKIENAGKYSYVERNCELIDKSSYCIFYYNKNYILPLKQATKSNMLLPRKLNSGTKYAYEYALKKKKIVINLYK